MKQLALDTLSIDGSLIQSFAFKDKTGYSGKHNKTGTKISTIADATGIPLAMVTAKGNIVDIIYFTPEIGPLAKIDLR